MNNPASSLMLHAAHVDTNVKLLYLFNYTPKANKIQAHNVITFSLHSTYSAWQ